MRRGLLFTLSFLLVLCLCACESKNEKEARAAYSEKRYGDVVSIMFDKKSNNDEINKMVELSEAFLAYENQNYSRVIEILSDEAILEPEFQEILIHSNAKFAYEQGNFDIVVSLLGGDETYNQDPIVVESWEVIFGSAFENRNIDEYVYYAEMDGAPTALAAEVIIDSCNEFDYDSFLFLDSAVKELSNESLISRLTEYSMENGKTRTKAFLKGTWEWQIDEEIKTHVELYVSDDDSQCVAYITQVGSDLIQYSYNLGEVYWKDFVFEDGMLVSMYNLTKAVGGRTIGSKAQPDIYFETDTMLLTLEEINWFYNSRVTTPSRTWVKISSDYLCEQP